MIEARGPVRAVLFDLDGTLVHTAPDIGAALNTSMLANGLARVSEAQVAAFIGRGGRVLAQRAIESQARHEPELALAVFEGYVEAYRTQLATLSRPLPGAARCLQELSARGLQLAVVTNALQRFAEAILAHYGLSPHLRLIVGADRVSPGKPHPDPLWFACRTLGVQPHEAVMVGDSINDIEAADAAGCMVVGISGGYVGDRPLTHSDCTMIDTLAELPALLESFDPQGASGSAPALNPSPLRRREPPA
jgi:phosphoglycolate phosphatase